MTAAQTLGALLAAPQKQGAAVPTTAIAKATAPPARSAGDAPGTLFVRILETEGDSLVEGTATPGLALPLRLAAQTAEGAGEAPSGSATPLPFAPSVVAMEGDLQEMPAPRGIGPTPQPTVPIGASPAAGAGPLQNALTSFRTPDPAVQGPAAAISAPRLRDQPAATVNSPTMNPAGSSAAPAAMTSPDAEGPTEVVRRGGGESITQRPTPSFDRERASSPIIAPPAPPSRSLPTAESPLSGASIAGVSQPATADARRAERSIVAMAHADAPSASDDASGQETASTLPKARSISSEGAGPSTPPNSITDGPFRSSTSPLKAMDGRAVAAIEQLRPAADAAPTANLNARSPTAGAPQTNSFEKLGHSPHRSAPSGLIGPAGETAVPPGPPASHLARRIGATDEPTRLSQADARTGTAVLRNALVETASTSSPAHSTALAHQVTPGAGVLPPLAAHAVVPTAQQQRSSDGRSLSSALGDEATSFAAGSPLGSSPSAQAPALGTQRPSFAQTLADAALRPPGIEAMQVQKLADGRVEVHLEPPELGRVEIAFDFGEDGLRATLTSDRPGTADLVRRHADMLLQQLRAAGFENATLDLGGHTRQDRAPDHPRANALNDISIKTTGTNMSDPEQAVSQQRLDLRF